MASRSRQKTVPASGAPAPAGDTRERVLTAAMQVFAEHGFDGATLREITALAGANIAAVNYYFRSKDELIRHVLDVYVRPIMASRLEALDECERRAGERGPDLEAVIEALVLPMVYLSRDRRGGRALIRLLLQSRARPRDARAVSGGRSANRGVQGGLRGMGPGRQALRARPGVAVRPGDLSEE